MLDIRKCIFACGVVVALTYTPALAHHSFSMFDADKTITLEGTVREIQWTSPHVWIQLIVMGENGPVEYGIEGNSPIVLSRRGWSHNSVKAGDKLTIQIHPMKDGSKGGAFVTATLPNGQSLSN